MSKHLFTQNEKLSKGLDVLALLILACYPLRHIAQGLDLWDTGYNYANFTYMGTQHMDSMWLFSTYLANALGHVMTLLPGGDTLLGLNLYTGLLVSLLALAGYLFATRSLQIAKLPAFVGEMIAVSFCWCPTALLYNYLTYVLLLACVILLFFGLTRERKGCLVAAGACLGCNVFVRFSNLPEMALIVAVWGYVCFCAWEERRKTWKKLFSYTGYCLLGYLVAAALVLGYLSVRYGLGNYVDGIRRLFAMTESASDYAAASMLMGMFDWYFENLYWIMRMGVFLVAGLVAVGGAKMLREHAMKKVLGEGTSVACDGESRGQQGHAPSQTGESMVSAIRLERAFTVLEWGFCALLAVVMVAWLYRGAFSEGGAVYCSVEYYSYGAILWPGVTFLTLTLTACLVQIVRRTVPKEEKVIALLVILLIGITPLGSNNKLYPAFNNLFLAAPYAMWVFHRFLCQARDVHWKKLVLALSPVKCLLLGFLALFLVQVLGFGATFVFTEATGAQDMTASVDNNEALAGISMNPEKAQWLTELSAYVHEEGLIGQDVILYGNLPALSFYLQMPAAFNPWPDLASYQYWKLEEDLSGVAKEHPVVIVAADYAVYAEGGMEALLAAGISEASAEKIAVDEKWELLLSFLEENGYEKCFANDRFAVYR